MTFHIGHDAGGKKRGERRDSPERVDGTVKSQNVERRNAIRRKLRTGARKRGRSWCALGGREIARGRNGQKGERGVEDKLVSKGQERGRQKGVWQSSGQTISFQQAQDIQSPIGKSWGGRSIH